MKKMVKWLETLQKSGVEIKLSEAEDEEESAETGTPSTDSSEPAEAVTTLEVGGMDTAETAKPKIMAKSLTEEKENKEE